MTEQQIQQTNEEAAEFAALSEQQQEKIISMTAAYQAGVIAGVQLAGGKA